MIDDALFSRVSQAVLQAGTLFFDRDMAGQVRRKSATDFVTAVDLAVEEQLKAALAALAPEIQFMGEEQDNSGLDRAGRIWILDPVDGTTNFVHDFHHSAISLGLAEAGQITAGLVYDPYARELYSARQGRGAFCNDRPIRVSPTQSLAESLISVGTNPSRRDLADRSFAWMRRAYDHCHDVRRVGAASLALCHLASGRTEGYLEQGLKPWDYAASLCILREAGGVLSDERGNPPDLFTGCNVVASNGLIQDQLLALLRDI